MEEAYCCLCGTDNEWVIFAAHIRCNHCGRDYRRVDAPPDVFNANREAALIKDCELQEGAKDGSVD